MAYWVFPVFLGATVGMVLLLIGVLYIAWRQK